MSTAPHLWIALGFLVVGFSAWWFARRRVTISSGSADALVIGSIDAPLITITPLETPHSQTQPIPESSGIASYLEPLLNLAPELLRLGSEISTRTLRVVFSPEVTRGLQSGSLRLSQDGAMQLLPVACDAQTGHYIEWGRGVTTGGMQLADAAAATWQIAAIATSQHYLAEINVRLQRIEDRLRDIQFFQREEKRAEIRSAVHLLKQYHDAIFRAALHPNEVAAIYQKIEDIEEKCLAVSELGRRLAEEESQKLDGIEVRENTDPLGTERRAGEWLNRCKQAAELVILAESCRVIACHVKAALPGDRVLIKRRIEDIRTRGYESVGHFIAMEGRFNQKIVQPLNPSGDLLREILSYRDHGRDAANSFARVRKEVSNMAQNLDAQAKITRAVIQRFDQLAESGLALDVNVDRNGKVAVLSLQTS